MSNPPPTPPIELSGMIYHGGKYDAGYWLALTGYDPRHYPSYFWVRESGYVVARPAYHEHVKRHNANIRNNWRCGLGVNA